MTFDTELIEKIAIMLDDAESTRVPARPLSEIHQTLGIEDAYRIQLAWLDIKVSRRNKLVGRKIGLTSKAMQDQLNVREPDYGALLDHMVSRGGSVIEASSLIQPRVEPEIAFWLARDLAGPGVTRDAVLAATRGVCAAVEVVDSRIVDWRIKLVDTIADNGSSARAILSERVLAASEIDLAAESVTMSKNGAEVGRGDGAAVLGHPADAVAWLANRLGKYSQSLRAGEIVLPGAMCASVPVRAGDSIQAVFAALGDVRVDFS